MMKSIKVWSQKRRKMNNEESIASIKMENRKKIGKPSRKASCPNCDKKWVSCIRKWLKKPRRKASPRKRWCGRVWTIWRSCCAWWRKSIPINIGNSYGNSMESCTTTIIQKSLHVGILNRWSHSVCTGLNRKWRKLQRVWLSQAELHHAINGLLLTLLQTIWSPNCLTSRYWKPLISFGSRMKIGMVGIRYGNITAWTIRFERLFGHITWPHG
mgnify:CR=1 FL=1